MISKTCLLYVCVLLPGCASKPAPTVSHTPSGDFHIAWRSAAAPRSLDVVPVIVQVTDTAGHPLSGADVSIDLSMPSMPMPEDKIALRQTQPGTYIGTARFTMSGAWSATVTAAKNGTQARHAFSIAVE